MYLKFLSAIAGHNYSYADGDIVQWPDDAEAQRAVARGIAVSLLPEEAHREAARLQKPVRVHVERPIVAQQSALPKGGMVKTDGAL